MKTLFENWRRYVNEQEEGDPKKAKAVDQLVTLGNRLHTQIEGGDNLFSQWGGDQEQKAGKKSWVTDMVLMLKMRRDRVAAGQYDEPPPNMQVDLTSMMARVHKGLMKWMDALSFGLKLRGKAAKKAGKVMGQAAASQADAAMMGAGVAGEMFQEGKCERRLRREAAGDVSDDDKTFQRAKASLLRGLERVVQKHSKSERDTSAAGGWTGHGGFTKTGFEEIKNYLKLIEKSDDVKEVNILLREMKEGIESQTGDNERDWVSREAFNTYGDSAHFKIWNDFTEVIRHFENAMLDLAEDGLENSTGIAEKMVTVIRSPTLSDVWMEDIEQLLLDIIARLASGDKKLSGWQW